MYVCIDLDDIFESQQKQIIFNAYVSIIKLNALHTYACINKKITWRTRVRRNIFNNVFNHSINI